MSVCCPSSHIRHIRHIRLPTCVTDTDPQNGTSRCEPQTPQDLKWDFAGESMGLLCTSAVIGCVGLCVVCLCAAVPPNPPARATARVHTLPHARTLISTRMCSHASSSVAPGAAQPVVVRVVLVAGSFRSVYTMRDALLVLLLFPFMGLVMFLFSTNEVADPSACA